MGTEAAVRAASPDTGNTGAHGAARAAGVGAKSLADFVGYRHPPHTAEVERGRLRFFARAIGETRGEFVDVEAARAMGYPDLVAAPTYAFSLELDQPRPFAILEALGVRLERVLHGSQHFRWHRAICAGERITLESQVEEVYEKKGGALQFIVIRTLATNERGELAVEMTKTVVVRGQRGK